MRHFVYKNGLNFCQFHLFSIKHCIGKTAYPIAQNNHPRRRRDRGIEHDVLMAEDEVIDIFSGVFAVIFPRKPDKGIFVGVLRRWGISSGFAGM